MEKFQFEMELEIGNFQQHTKVRWLTIGPAIKRILEQWEAITHFVADISKDSKKVPKSINFKRVYMLLGTKDKISTKVTLEFLNDVVPVFEQLLLVFQKESPVVHIMYDSLCDSLLKLMRRFMQAHVIDKKFGSDLISIDCKSVKIQLQDKELVIGINTRKVLKELPSDQQKHALLGICSFFGTTVTELQQKLSLQNNLLQQLGCLNPSKRTTEFTVAAMNTFAGVLQPNISRSEVVDEWKLLQVDSDLPTYDKQERIEKYWKRVFQLQSHEGELRYKVLPTIVKSALILGQTNAESEHSLSVNTKVVTKERASLNERTIVGLCVVKEAVRFFDPVSNQPEKIIITDDMLKSVKSDHAMYREWLEREKEEEEEKKREVQRRKQISEQAQKERENLVEKKESLAKSEESLNEQEEKARQELSAADELLKDARLKLDSALASKPISANSMAAAKMMLEAIEKKRKEAMEKLDKIRKKQIIRQINTQAFGPSTFF